MKQWWFSASFESDTQPVETVNGTVQATALSTAISRAARQAQRGKPSRNRWRSFVILIEPRQGVEGPRWRWPVVK